MSSERWQRARDLFEQALDLSEAEQEPFLDQACGDDNALRGVLDQWLKADAEATGFLESGVVTTPPFTAPDLEGRSLGNCSVLERLGEGGMGTVYRARQKDDTFDRDVAIKILTFAPVGAEGRRRFARERRILGTLDHPGIARIFDGGETEEGFPYLVLEFVDGQEIDRYCETHDLTLRERLGLFREVCNAVSGCHQHLVVHRDLKPSNILVDGAGKPRLLDFGIAKLLDADGGTGPGSDGTRPWSRPLTPQYASPEQIRGEAISTASDVYSLGVLLYKLLCGVPPKSVEGLGLKELIAELDRPPTAPSGHSEVPSELARQLTGDLDSIVLKALRQEPSDRYSSVEALDNDIGRFLDNLPVEARRGGRTYRVARFLRRHRASVALVSAAALTLLAFTLGLWRANTQVTAEKTKLQEVVRFFFSVFEQAGPLVAEGQNVSVKDALDRSAVHLATGLADQPRIRAPLASILGDIYLQLGEEEEALEWSQEAFELHRSLDGAESVEAASSLDLVGASLRQLWRYDEANKVGEEALATLREQPNTPREVLIRALNNRSTLLCYLEDYEAARPFAAEALTLAETHLPAEHPERIEALLQQAVLTNRLGDPEDAIELYGQAAKILASTYAGTHPLLPLLHNNLARIFVNQDRVDEAAEQYRKADEQYQKVFGTDFFERVKPLSALATLADRRGDFDEATQLYQTATEIGRKSGSPPYALRPLLSLAERLIETQRCADAEHEIRASLNSLSAHKQKPWRFYAAEGLLGESVLCQGRRAEAQEIFQRSLQNLEPLRDKAPQAYEAAQDRIEQLAR